MSKDKEVLYSELSQAVLEMDEERSVHISGEIVAEQYDAYEAVVHGLADGMDRAGRLFEEEEYFIPELLMCSDAMYAGLEVLKPHLKREESGGRKKVVIGVVEGDTHDIGKNLVKIMLETSGFDVYDLGRDISPQKFVDKAKEWGLKSSLFPL
jgi:Predicted cobalamin binding protein